MSAEVLAAITWAVAASVGVLLLMAMPSRTTQSDASVTVGGDDLGIRLSLVSGRLSESGFVVVGAPMPGLAGQPWSVEVDGTRYDAQDDSARLVSATRHQARFAGENAVFAWTLTYVAHGPSRVTKALTLVPKRPVQVQRVRLWQAQSPEEPVVARTSLQGIAAFYRYGADGLFVSLDFPYSDIVSARGVTTVGYPPFDRVETGQEYDCHSLTLGATSVRGRVRHGYHEGEVEAMDRYVQERFQARFQRPLFSSACINNRYTQVEDDWVFYSLADHPTLTTNRDLLRRELALMPKLGMEYYQVFPGVFDWGPDDPTPAMVREAMGWAHANGLRMGDYSGANHLFCGHYNQHRNTLDHPDWRTRDEEGNALAFCFGKQEFTDFYVGKVVPTCREFGFELHCLDFLSLAPCYATDHGHPPGPDSVYSQVRGMVRFMEAVNAVSPEMLIWPNSGNWAEFLPKLAWYAPSLYLTDPFVASPWQGLNQTRVLDDSRREQMVNLHYSHFVPYRFFTNCQYFFSRNSIVPDVRANYEYGALASLAVTPNLCLAEVRPWLDSLSPSNQAKVTAFYKEWTDHVRQRFGPWTRTYHVGDDPGPGAVEIYSHADGDRGLVFIVNPQYWNRTVEVPLDASLGFTQRGECEIAELYPTPCVRLTAQGPFAQLGTRLPVDVPAQQVLVFEARPAPAATDEPRLYGLPGTVEATPSGYLAKVRGPQGTPGRFAVLTPKGGPRIRAAAVRCVLPEEDPRQPSATPLDLLVSDKRGALLGMTFRRAPAPTELRDWVVCPGSLAAGVGADWHQASLEGQHTRFPLSVDVRGEALSPPFTAEDAAEAQLGPLAAFCGAYIDNAVSEVQETWIDLGTGDAARPRSVGDSPQEAADAAFASLETMAEPEPLSPLAREARAEWWLQTRFSLPFMYTLGCEPALDDHTVLVLPLLPQTAAADIQAWVNGVALNVQRYSYPRNRAFGCYYADLVGTAARHGDNVLTIHYAVSR